MKKGLLSEEEAGGEQTKGGERRTSRLLFAKT
jgi:hypothetical protein